MRDLMKSTRRLLGLLCAAVVSGLAVVPAANATMFEQFRFVDDPYAFDETICGIDVHIEGTATGAGSSRTGKGKLASAFFSHVNFAYTETWTAANDRFVTVTGKANNNEVKAVPLGDNVFRFTDTQAGQPFRLYDSEGNLLLRDRGVIRSTFDFDTLGDDEPGGELVQDVELSVRGPHPGFEDETLCPVLVPLLTGP
jgi:hypothetical protein